MNGERDGSEALAFVVFGCAALLASAAAAALAVPLALLAQRSPARWLALFLAGTAGAALTWPAFVDELHEGWAALTRVGLAVDPGRAVSEAWPHVWRWWLLALPIAPLYAGAFELVRPRSVAELEDRREVAQRRRAQRAVRTAARRAQRMSSDPADLPERCARRGPAVELVGLGARVAGDGLLVADRRGRVAMPVEWLRRHALVIGPSGSGKTETLLRLAFGVAHHGWAIYYVDAKGDAAGAKRFASALGVAGVEPTVFPATPLDGWRGDQRAIYNRLLELVAYATEGDGAYYRDVARRALWLACNAEGGPPRSSSELLERLSPARLRETEGGQALAAADARALGGVQLRYEAFFAALGRQLDGDRSFEDAKAMYLLLDSLRLREEAQSLARFVIEDFADFAVERKPRERPALLIVDEYSAVAEAGRIVELVERLRSYNVGVVLAPQVEAGMGDDAASDRVIQNAETVFLHGLKRPEGIVSLAGTHRRLETSYQQLEEHATGLGSSRAQHQFRVDPNDVRALNPGECFVIRRGRADRIKVARAPAGTHASIADTDGALAPEPASEPVDVDAVPKLRL